jgi:hypothetical protein
MERKTIGWKLGIYSIIVLVTLSLLLHCYTGFVGLVPQNANGDGIYELCIAGGNKQ